MGSSRLPSGVLAVNHLGTGDQHLVTFAAHLLDQDGDLHFAAAADVENFGASVCSMRRATLVRIFFDEPLPDMAGGDQLAVLPAERAVVDGELHLDGRRIDRHERQRRRAPQYR